MLSVCCDIACVIMIIKLVLLRARIRSAVLRLSSKGSDSIIATYFEDRYSVITNYNNGGFGMRLLRLNPHPHPTSPEDF